MSDISDDSHKTQRLVGLMSTQSFRKLIYGAGLMMALILGFVTGAQTAPIVKPEKIADLDGRALTVDQLRRAYSIYLSKISRMANAEQATLGQLACNPAQAPENQMWKDVVRNLDPREYYQAWTDLMIVESAAKKDSFLKDPEIQEILASIQLESIAQLYVQKRMEDRVKITDPEARTKCAGLRKEFPAEFGNLSEADCMRYASGFLKRNQMQTEFPQLRNEIKASVPMQNNEAIDRNKILSEIPEYIQLKKAGGC